MTTAADELLASLGVRVSAFAVCRVGPGWRLLLGPASAPMAHYVLRGFGLLRLDNGETISVAPHDLVLLPPGARHSLETSVASGRNGQHHREPVLEATGLEGCSALADGLVGFSAGAEGDGPGKGELVSVCGAVEATYAGGSRGLFDRLGAPVQLRLAGEDPLRGAFEAMLAELASPTLGTRALAEALLKQCLVLLVRRLDPGELAGLLGSAGAADPRLVSALRAMLEHPARPHTVESLAAGVGMSRSGFALRYAEAFGAPPMEFLRGVRLRHAARLLEVTDLPVAAIARCVGYDSRTYFSRAFRAAQGITPEDYRSNKRQRR